MSCAGSFSGHVNRQQSIGVSFSPCGQYVGCGSEDNSGYVYDIRKPGGTFLFKLSGHTDVVSHVIFHPKKSYMATAAFDGKIRFFTENEISKRS